MDSGQPMPPAPPRTQPSPYEGYTSWSGSTPPGSRGPVKQRQALLALAAALVVVVAVVGALVIFRPDTASRSGPPSGAANATPTASPVARPTPKGSVPAPSKGKFNADGVSFRYPRELPPLDHVPYRFPSGDLRWVTAVGFNASDFVAVGKYRSPLAHPANQDAQFKLVQQMVGGVTSQLTAGHLFRDVVGATVHGLHGYTFAMAGTDEHSTSELEDIDVVLFSGHSIYFIECGATNFTEEAVGYTCGQVVDSFRAS